MRLRWLRIFSRLLIGAIFVVGVGALVSAVMVTQYGKTDHAAASDVIVILGAGTRADGRVSPAYARRIRHAITLYQRGLSPYLLCTGGYANRWRTKSEALSCKEYLLQLDIPESAILMEEVSRSTEENAIFTRTLMRAHGWQSAIISSDNYHVFRARRLFTNEGLMVYTSPATEQAPSNLYFTYLLREVVALQWQLVKEALNLPVTYVQGL